MHPKGNTQLQIRKWWVPLRSALYLFPPDLFKCLSVISTRCPTEETLKEIVHFFKTTILCTSAVPIPNVKPEIASKVYHMLYNNITGENTKYKFQSTEWFIRKGRTPLYYIHIPMYNKINWIFLLVLTIHFYIHVQFHARRCFCASLSVRVSYSGHPVSYARQ